MNAGQIVEKLVAVMETVRQAAVEAANALGIPLTHEVTVLTVRFDEEGTGWSGGDETVVESCLQDDDARQRILDAAFGATSDATQNAAGALVAAFGYPPVPQNVWSAKPEGSEPALWTDKHVVRPTVAEYLRLLRSLDTPDADIATQVAIDLVSHARDKQYEVVISLLVDGLETGADIVEVEGLRVRRLDRFEAGAAAAVHLRRRRDFDDWHLPTHLAFTGTAPRHVIQVRRRTDSEGVRRGIGGGGITAVVLAFELLGFDLAGTGFYSEVPQPRWLAGASRGAPIQIASHSGDSRSIDAGDLASVWELVAKLPDGAGDHPTTPETFALHRFMLGCARRDAVDAVVDFVIAMEAVLLRGQQGEPTFRFAAQGGAFLEPPGPARRKAFEDLRHLYAIRSDIVHGGTRFPSTAAAAEARRLRRATPPACWFAPSMKGGRRATFSSSASSVTQGPDW